MAKKIIEILQSEPAENMVQVQQQIGDIYLCSVNIEQRKLYIELNMRQLVRNFCANQGVSTRKLSELIDFDYINFNKFMNEKRDLPAKYLYRLLAILID